MLEVHIHSISRMRFVVNGDYITTDLSGARVFMTSIVKICDNDTFTIDFIPTDLLGLMTHRITDLDEHTYVEMLIKAITNHVKPKYRNDNVRKIMFTIAVSKLDELVSGMPFPSAQMIQYLKAFKTVTLPYILAVKPMLRGSFPKIEKRLDDLLKEEADRRYANKKARTIQCAWRHVICCPYHDICKRRLLREFSELVS